MVTTDYASPAKKTKYTVPLKAVDWLRSEALCFDRARTPLVGLTSLSYVYRPIQAVPSPERRQKIHHGWVSCKWC